MAENRITRRTLVAGAAAVPIAVALASCGDDEDPRATSAGTLPRTPACDDGGESTPEQTEGPYFLPDSPERTSLLEGGMGGTKLLLAGRVLSTDCKPVRRALIDFWQADDAGEYDLDGFRLRGHQFTGKDGSFKLETVVPGLYPGRTRHIHVKVQPPNGSILTTQLYFPDEAANDSDAIFSGALVVAQARPGRARFDFVL